MTDDTITNIHLSEQQLKFQPMYFLPTKEARLANCRSGFY